MEYPLLFTGKTSYDTERGSYYGWILYTEKESVRNEAFIGLCFQACRRYGISAELAVYEEKTPWSQEKEQALRAQAMRRRPCFALNRTRDFYLAFLLEEMGIAVYNSSKLCRLGNDKAAAYEFMRRRGIPVMPTFYYAGAAMREKAGNAFLQRLPEPETAELLSEPQAYPVVIKAAQGHGGTEVFLVENARQWRKWELAHKGDDRRYLFQEMCSEPGKDVRVYVVGNRIAAAVLRTSETDFRSNYSLGGHVSAYELQAAEQALVEKILSELQIGYAGIDLIFHNGKPVLNEIEDMAGARMLYEATDIDLADVYIRYIGSQRHF